MALVRASAFLCLTLAVVRVHSKSGRTDAARGETATGCPKEMPASEEARVAEFKRIHGSWPPKLRYPGALPAHDTEKWYEFLKRKEIEIRNHQDHQWRWDYMLEQVQVMILRNFTERGWGVGQMPAKLADDLRDAYRQDRNKGYDEGVVPGYISGERTMTQVPSGLRQQLVEESRRQIAEWAGFKPDELEVTSVYGIRTYFKDSTLKTHVDKPETHILSAVYMVDRSENHNVKEPWNVVVDPEWSGDRIEINQVPGQLFYYESAKLYHGRPSTLLEDYSAHIFLHFRPKWWTFENVDRVYGAPPGWYLSNEEYNQKKHEL